MTRLDYRLQVLRVATALWQFNNCNFVWEYVSLKHNINCPILTLCVKIYLEDHQFGS